MPTNQSSPWGDGPSSGEPGATRVPFSPTKDDGDNRTSNGASEDDGGNTWSRITAVPHLEPTGSCSPGGRSQQAAAGDAPIRGQRPLQVANQTKLDAADSPSPPPLCLNKKDASSLGCKKPEVRSTRTRTTRRNHSAKLTTKRCQTQNCSSTGTRSSQLLVRGGPPAVLPTNRTNRTKQDSRGFLGGRFRVSQEETPAAVTADVSSSCAGEPLGSVTSQISAIRLTRQDRPPSPTREEDQQAQSRPPAGLDSLEEELPDELENACSDDDDSDCSSIIGSSSTASVAQLSSVEESMLLEAEDDREERPALVPSLFPLMPPTLYFSTAKEKVELLPTDQRRQLKWKMSSVTPNVVKLIVGRSHFKTTKKSHDWLGCWGHHMKSPIFKTLGEHQKLNHFPGTFQIGRKDRLWRNLSRMQLRFGRQEFSFFPRTFVLPQDIKLLRKAWEDGGSKQKWIIKPVFLLFLTFLTTNTSVMMRKTRILVTLLEQNCEK